MNPISKARHPLTKNRELPRGSGAPARGFEAGARASNAEANQPPRGLGSSAHLRQASSLDGFERLEHAPPSQATASDDTGDIVGVRSIVDLVERGGHALWEVAWNELRKIGGTIDLRDGACLGLRIEDQVYGADSDFVKNDPVRRTTAEAIRSTGANVVWIQTGGFLELGVGVAGTLPVPSTPLDLSGGFRARTLARYEVVRPFAFRARPSGEDAVDLARTLVRGGLVDPFVLPVSASSARGMPAGAEVELSGLVASEVEGHVAIGRSAGLGPFWAGVDAGVGASATTGVERSVKIKAIDGEALLQVTVSETSSVSGGIDAAIRAGLTAGRGDVIPELGSGALLHLVEGIASHAIGDFAEDFLSAQIAAKRQWSESRRVIDAFVLDLSRPTACAVYRELVLGGLAGAKSACGLSGSGVSRAELRETELASRSERTIRAFGQKLLLFEALERSTRGEVRDGGRRELAYRGTTYEKKKQGFFSGRKEIRFDAWAVAPRGAERDAISYYHLTFRAHDKLVHAAEVLGLQRFGQALGLLESVVSRLEPREAGPIQRLFSGDDDIDVAIEVYFTPDGVEAIDRAGAREGVAAYLAAAAALDPRIREHPGLHAKQRQDGLHLLEVYARQRWRARLGTSFRVLARRALASRYADATGRSLGLDGPVYLEALAFGERLASLRCADGSKASTSFFSKLGRCRGFDFMRPIVALALVAGLDRTLARMSLSGKAVTSIDVSEGPIMSFDPRAALGALALGDAFHTEARSHAPLR